MSESKSIPVHAVHYQALAGVGLGMLALGQHGQAVIALPNVLLMAFGGCLILFPRPRLPVVFLVCLAAIQTFAHYELYRNFRFTPAFVPFEPTTMLLAGGSVIFFACQYRLLAIRWHVTPHDPRIPSPQTSQELGRPVVPLNRPERVLTPDEIVRFVVAAAAYVLVGQLVWSWQAQNWTFGGLPSRFMQIAFLVWFAVIGLFVGAGIVGYWRRAHAEPEQARLYLQEIAWREARRDYGRIGRWIAWGKRKVKKNAADD